MMDGHRDKDRRICLRDVAFFAGLIFLAIGGCSDPRDQFGKTWYIDGIGNLGFGVAEVPAGLARAGYKGHVDNFRWSITFNPLLDQTLRIFARAGGARLSGVIQDYQRQFPNNEVNVIGLSAGTGVAMWAAEDLKPPAKISNVVLLASSLSNRFDARKALANISGQVIVFYSPHDPVLDGPCRLTGTIDGKFEDSAGLTGLRGPGFETGRIKNIPWNASYERLGWTGAHTDCISEPFVRAEVSKFIVGGAVRVAMPALSLPAVAWAPVAAIP